MDNSTKKEIKLFEAFAGIGAQRRALENIAKKKGWKIDSIGQIEWYIDAIIGYQLIHHDFKKPTSKSEKIDLSKINFSSDSKKPCSPTAKKKLDSTKTHEYISSSVINSHNLIDITETNGEDIPKFIDIFTYSFPCQDLSIQGKQLGMNKEDKTRSGLLWEVGRILKEMNSTFGKKEMPKYLLMENVAAIISHNHKPSFEKWLKKLDSYGYESNYWLLDSSDYGSPQRRKRVFCLSIRKDLKSEFKFKFKKPEAVSTTKASIKKIMHKNAKDVPSNCWLSKLEHFERKKYNTSRSNIKKESLIGYTNFNSEAYLYDIHHSGPTLTASGANSRIKVLDYGKIRSLSAEECIKYMGFTKKDYKSLKSKELLSDNDIIFLAGNSIPVCFLEAIFNNLVF